jgi:hypothetical protein
MPGGLRVAETTPGIGRFGPLLDGDITLEISSFPALGKDVRRRTGLLALGTEYLHTEEEINGSAQGDWRSVLPSRANEWPTRVAEVNWSGLSNAARLRGDARLYLIAGSITSQCRFAGMRLLDLSNLYSRNIRSLLESGDELSDHVVMRGYHSDSLFSSIHAAFFEMSTLRDYLGEYIAFAIYSQTKPDSFNKLHELLKRRLSTPLEREIEQIYGQPTGWLKQFSDRRNTLAHRMPFDRLAGGGVMHVRRHETPSGELVWLLHIPVPEPVPITHKHTFSLPSDELQHAKQQIESMKLAATRQDTLSYLFETFGRLIDFGNRLRPTFPYPPQVFTIADKDIISLTVRRESRKQ